MTHHRELILASTSVYRKAQLEQLGLPFIAAKPTFDEEQFKQSAKTPALNPRELAETLAYLKAESLAKPGSVVIGGDQLVSHQGKVLGKPHTREKAIEQLLSMQGREHQLITAVCIFDGNEAHPFVDITTLTMKMLNQEQVRRYVDLDQPLDCAGAYKIEKHGMMLFEKIDSQDFSAIQGLPLLAVSRILSALGFSIP
jgi:septum formation protein